MKVDERPFEEAAANFASRQLLKSMRPAIREDICAWTERSVDLSYDHTSSALGNVHLFPYQREPLTCCDDPNVQEVTVQASQRLGKSSIWKYALLKRVHDGGCSGLIIYPSMELAERTNQDTVLPLLATLPEASRDLATRGNKKRGSYHLPSLSSVIYFLGSGIQVTSQTANFAVLDECDFCSMDNADDEARNMSQLKAVRLRLQSFKRRMLIVCSSPSQYGGVVHQNWKRGSMGEWNLRCLHCGELSPVKQLAFFVDGSRWAGLQWQKDERGDVIEDSIRWICPHCGHAHTYDDAPAMNEQGCYVHQRPSNLLHRSFQVGTLAAPSIFTWREIAQAQEDATDADGKKYLCNTILGMPYRHQAASDASQQTIEAANTNRRIEYPSDLSERISVVLAGVDVQSSELAGAKYYVAAVRGFCENGDSYLLSAGTDNSLDALAARLSATYYGHRVLLTLIDNGGFNSDEDVKPFVEAHPSVFWYKGTSSKIIGGKLYQPAPNARKLFLCSALGYQVKLLDLLYSPARASGYRWNLPLECDQEYFRQLCAVRPNTRMAKDGNGWAFANWATFGADSRRDFFDCEKQILAALDIACDNIPHTAFTRGHIPTFVAKEKLMALARTRRLTQPVNK